MQSRDACECCFFFRQRDVCAEGVVSLQKHVSRAHFSRHARDGPVAEAGEYEIVPLVVIVAVIIGVPIAALLMGVAIRLLAFQDQRSNTKKSSLPGPACTEDPNRAADPRRVGFVTPTQMEDRDEARPIR